MLDNDQEIENNRFPLGLTDGKFLQWVDEGEYFYGTTLQGQILCWEIKVNLVTGIEYYYFFPMRANV